MPFFLIPLYLLIGSMVVYCTNLLNNKTLNLIVSSLVGLFCLFLFFHASIRRKLSLFVLMEVIIYGMEFVVVMMYVARKGTEINEPLYEFPGMAQVIIFNYIALSIVSRWIKRTEKRNLPLIWIELIFPILSFMMLYLMVDYSLITVQTGRVFSLIGMLLILGNIVLFYYIERTIRMIRTDEEYRTALEENALNVSRYAELEKEEQSWRQREHDLTKVFTAIAGLAQENKNQEIVKLLDDLKIRFRDAEKKRYTGNGVVDMLLNAKFAEAEREQIEVDFYAEPNLMLDRYEIGDMIAIIGNQIENAIDAAKLCRKNKKYIRSRYYHSENGQLVLETENSYEHTLVKHGGEYRSTKKDASRHGYGLKIIKEKAEHYGGLMDVRAEGNRFHSVVMLPGMSDPPAEEN